MERKTGIVRRIDDLGPRCDSERNSAEVKYS